jgi:hypothetical protein
MKRKGRKRFGYDIPNPLYKRAKSLSKELNVTMTKLHLKALIRFIKHHQK